jgi:hypothetical protein
VCFCWELGLGSKPSQEANSKGSPLDRNEATGVLLLGARVGQQALTRSKLRRVSS